MCDVAGGLNYRLSEPGCLVSEMIGVLHEREARVKVGNLVLVVFTTGFNLLMAETGLRLFYAGVGEDLQVSAYRAYSVEEQDVREGPFSSLSGERSLPVTPDPWWWHPYFSWNMIKLDRVCARAFMGQGQRSMAHLIYLRIIQWINAGSRFKDPQKESSETFWKFSDHVPICMG